MAVTGLGLAWLAAGTATKRQRPLRLPPPQDPARLGGLRSANTALDYEVSSAPRPRPAYDHRTYERAHGFRSAADPMAGFEERLARANGDFGRDHAGDDANDPTVKERISDAMASAKEKLMSLKTRLADAAHDSKTSARELRTYLTEGTEQMSDSTRNRVVAARQAAWDAEKKLESYARDYAGAGREFYGSQPLIGGLVAFGLGAAIGAALPRTRQEDHYLGSYRDRAMEEAERYYRSEVERLRGVAENAVEDAKRMANETLNNVVAEAKGEGSKDASNDDGSTAASGNKGTTGSASGGSTTRSTGGTSSAGSTGGTSPVGSTGGTSSVGSTGGTTGTAGTTGGNTTPGATSGTTATSFKSEGNGFKGS